MTPPRKYPIGTVFIHTTASLDETASRVAAALSIKLQKAPVGRFEERSGYEGEAMGLTMHLTGDSARDAAVNVNTCELNVFPSPQLFNDPSMALDEIDISDFLELVLSRNPDLEVSTTL